MFNPVTDRLKLVVKMSDDGRLTLGRMPLPFFNRTVAVVEGFSQEIFRNGNHLDSVRPTDPTRGKTDGRAVKVQSGDIVYRVTLAPQPYNFTGTIQSKDKFQKIYDMDIVLVVNDAKRLMEWYHQSKDPAGWVISRFKENFERWASTVEHDKLKSASSSWANITQLLSNQCGIRITQARWVLRADPIREREWEIRRDTELRKIQIEKEHEIKRLEEQLQRERERVQKEYERDEKSRQNDFIRTEKLKNRQNEASMQLLSETVKELVTMNRERIREAIDYNNGSIKTVLQDSLRSLSVFNGPVPENEEVIDADTTLSEEKMSLEREEDLQGLDTEIDFPSISGDEMGEDVGQSAEIPQ